MREAIERGQLSVTTEWLSVTTEWLSVTTECLSNTPGQLHLRRAALSGEEKKSRRGAPGESSRGAAEEKYSRLIARSR